MDALLAQGLSDAAYAEAVKDLNDELSQSTPLVGDLADDQKALVKSTLKALLDPYRAEDVKEAFALIEKAGGLDQLHMAFYQEGDLEDDKIWDMWRIEGPGLVCHFRGAPHVHAYINITAG